MESPPTYRSMGVEKRADRGDSNIKLDSTKARPVLQERRDRELEIEKSATAKKTLDIEVYKKGVTEKDVSHMSSRSGALEHFLNLNIKQAHLT